MAIDLTQLAVRPTRLVKVLREHLPGVHPSAPRAFGPAGMAVILLDRDNQHAGSVIVTQAEHGGAEWLHASLAWIDHVPAYDDLTTLKRAVFGDARECYQVFPGADRHVNIHAFALHLWGRADGVPALPDFTRGMGSI